MGITHMEFCFLCQILTHEKGYILNDDILGFERTKAFRLRKSLKEKGFLNFFSEKGKGTKYYVILDTIISKLPKKEKSAEAKPIKEKPVEVKPVVAPPAPKIDDFSAEEVVLLKNMCTEAGLDYADYRRRFKTDMVRINLDHYKSKKGL
jgi:hypothetical protein